MDSKERTAVLFVCLGNICRSPMAEAVFRHLVQQEGLEHRFVIDSAGTGGWHVGKPPHYGTRKILEENNIRYDDIRARQIEFGDLTRFDYIVAMDTANEEDLRWLARGAKDNSNILKLLDLVPEAGMPDVPDPYYTGNFHQVYDLVDRGCRALLEKIRSERKL